MKTALRRCDQTRCDPAPQRAAARETAGDTEVLPDRRPGPGPEKPVNRRQGLTRATLAHRTLHTHAQAPALHSLGAEPGPKSHRPRPQSGSSRNPADARSSEPGPRTTAYDPQPGPRRPDTGEQDHVLIRSQKCLRAKDAPCSTNKQTRARPRRQIPTLRRSSLKTDE